MVKLFKVMLVGTALISMASAKRIQNDAVIGVHPFSFQPQMREMVKNPYEPHYANSSAGKTFLSPFSNTTIARHNELLLDYGIAQSLKTAAQEKLRREQEAAKINRVNQQILDYGIYLSQVDYATQQSLKTAAQEKLRREQEAAKINRVNQQILDYGIYQSELELAIQQSLKEEKVRQLQPTLNSFNHATDDFFLQMAIQNSLQTKEEEDLKAAIEASKQTFKQETLKRMQERSKPNLRESSNGEQRNTALYPSLETFTQPLTLPFTVLYPRLDTFTGITVDSQDSLSHVKQHKTLGNQSAKLREKIQNNKVDLLKNSEIEDRQILTLDTIDPLFHTEPLNTLPVKSTHVRTEIQNDKVGLLKGPVVENRSILVTDMLEELPTFDLPVVSVPQVAPLASVIPPAPPPPPALPTGEIKVGKKNWIPVTEDVEPSHKVSNVIRENKKAFGLDIIQQGLAEKFATLRKLAQQDNSDDESDNEEDNEF